MKLSRIFLPLIFVFFSCTGKSHKSLVDKHKGNMKNLTNPIAVIDTTEGEITLELFSGVAPKTVANFVGLALGEKEFTDPKTGAPVKRPYFDGLIFHRIIDNFMIQGGDILGNGTGGPGYRFDDEINSTVFKMDKKTVKEDQMATQKAQQAAIEKLGIKTQVEFEKKRKLIEKEYEKILNQPLDVFLTSRGHKFDKNLPSKKNEKGTISMANSGPNTNGSQFFINLKYNQHLDGYHTVFGKVIGGIDVVENIAKSKKDSQDKPEKDIVMKSVKIYQKTDPKK